ncbi:MAG TPA: glycosyltransferase, partial [Candidatus Sulfomarinibacteraceae bacterium]|nr:glycosyltransferase [Candidatus Sulfomarinibacteraceae bacterium]
MKTEFLVSIVINNYNYGHFLRDAIDSALQQTYDPLEVIVVDDGSTDDSHAIIEAYGERIIPIFKENGGQASALNAGFARSQGEIVIFLDADDVLHTAIAEKVVAAYTDAPEAARVHYRLHVVSARGEQTGTYVPPAYLPLAAGDLRERATALVNGTNWPPTSGNAFAAWSLGRILPMPEEAYRTCADYYLLRANALCGPVAALDEVGGYYRLHADNTFLRPELNVGEVRQQIALVQATGDCLRLFLDRLQASGAPDK